MPLIPGGASAAIKVVRTVGTVATKAENALSVVDGVMDGNFLEVSARAANGEIIRIDNLATRDGKLKIFEMKSSISAGYTKNQEFAGYPVDSLSQDYTIVGKKGGTMYPAGTVIPKGTIIQTLRPGSIVE